MVGLSVTSLISSGEKIRASGNVIRPPVERPRDFRHRDPTKWLVAFIVAAGALAALVAMNGYL